MEKRQMLWKTKGMNQDLSVSAFNPEIAFENMNLRLSTNEHNTLMSWVNEKGTKELEVGIWDVEHDRYDTSIPIQGVPIGTAVLNHKLVLFTHEVIHPEQQGNPDTYMDRIYVIEKNGNNWIGKNMYQGDLNFDENYPLETRVSYEMEGVQKVYWVDGRNQPRVFNIDGIVRGHDNTQFDFVPTLTLEETVAVEKKYGAGGMFAPGVIQYAFTYYNKYGPESNIFYTTPLYYISFTDRAAGPDEKVDNIFKITVSNFDTKFDYLRIYSIQRTSLNNVPIVKRVQDIQLDKVSEEGIVSKPYQSSSSKYVIKIDGVEKDIDLLAQEELSQENPAVATGVTIPTCDWWGGIKKADYPNLEVITSEGYVSWGSDSTNDSVMWFSSETSDTYYICETSNDSHDEAENLSYKEVPFNNSFSYIDTGLNGDSVDPTELLYKGGSDIIASTLEQKDNTLFFGNLQIKEENIGEIQISGSPLKDKIKESTISTSRRDINTLQISSGSYAYWNQLNDRNCAGFKFGNYYRLGVQFQYKTGKWSEPLFIDDAQQDLAPLQVVDTQQQLTSTFQLPVFTATIDENICEELVDKGYKRARAVVVYPNQNDRVVVCQGVAAPTIYTSKHRDGTLLIPGNNDLYAQSSWFFRTSYSDSEDTMYKKGLIAPTGSGTLPYTFVNIEEDNPKNGGTYDPEYIKKVEIQGEYEPENKFEVDREFLTFHSPEIEFNTSTYSTDFSGVTCYRVGNTTFTYTMSDIDIQTESSPISNLGSGFDHKTFSEERNYGIVSGLFYDDFILDDNTDSVYALEKEKRSIKWMVYLWNKTGSLNNDINRPSGLGTPSAILKKKIISNLRYANTVWGDLVSRTIIGSPQLFDSDQVSIAKVNGKIYQGNIDTVLTPDSADGMYFAYDDTNAADQIEVDRDHPAKDTSFTASIRFKTYEDLNDGTKPGIHHYEQVEGTWKWKRTSDTEIGDKYFDMAMKKELVRMKYKSTAHLAFMVDDNSSFSWEDYQLPIVEMRRDINPLTLFGGRSEDALRANTWIPCGEPVDLWDGTVDGQGKPTYNDISIEYSYGDTYYQRWDCLKTYAFTPEDENQVVEIGSFMLETYTNVEGRYDRNRGQKSNLNMSPRNFNLLNPVYSQQDNFFTYRITSNKDDTQVYPNQIMWSLTKTTGADVDAWTNVNLGSVLELDGDKGKISKLVRLNDKLIAFQESGISQILYNESVQVSTEQGVPIEIANSGKVQGSRYISDTVGCGNKWSMAQTPSGVYFMDSNEKSIYLLGEGLKNITQIGGFNTWSKNNILTYKTEDGEPLSAGAFKAFYDRLNQEVLFINQEKALAWSERIGAFTSFYNYGNAPFFVNLDDEGLWINQSQAINQQGELISTTYKLWEHQGGSYNRFFDVNKPYWTTLVGNPNPQSDKTFTNIEFRACVSYDNQQGEPVDTSDLPFDSLKTWNEYQEGLAQLTAKNGRGRMMHHIWNGTSEDNSLNRKFRIWRCDIPRDKTKRLDRMRNPWLYLKLMKDAAVDVTTNSVTTQHNLNRCEVHDVVMDYFV